MSEFAFRGEGSAAISGLIRTEHDARRVFEPLCRYALSFEGTKIKDGARRLAQLLLEWDPTDPRRKTVPGFKEAAHELMKHVDAVEEDTAQYILVDEVMTALVDAVDG